MTVNHTANQKKKIKYVDLYSASSRSASHALPLPVSRRWSSQANPTARHQRTLRDHVIRVGVSRDMPDYSPSLRRVLIPAETGSGWVGLGARFHAEVVYPSKDGHPPVKFILPASAATTGAPYIFSPWQTIPPWDFGLGGGLRFSSYGLGFGLKGYGLGLCLFLSTRQF